MVIGRLETFAQKVVDGLEHIDWLTQREIVRMLVKRIELDHDQVNVVFRIGELPPNLSTDPDCLQDCRRRIRTSLA